MAGNFSAIKPYFHPPLRLIAVLSFLLLLIVITATVFNSWKREEVRTPSGIVINKISWSPKEPLPGEQVIFYAEVKAQGRHAPREATYRVKFQIDGADHNTTDKLTVPFYRQKSVTHASDFAGQTGGLAKEWTASSGPHTIAATIERQDGGKDYTAYETIYVGVKAGKPDLIVEDISATTNPDNPSEITYSARVRNIGNTQTPPSWPLQVVFKSGGSRIAATNNTTEPLKPDEARSFTARGGLPADADGQGTIDIEAIVNENRRTGELNYANNALTKSVSINSGE